MQTVCRVAVRVRVGGTAGITTILYVRDTQYDEQTYSDCAVAVCTSSDVLVYFGLPHERRGVEEEYHPSVCAIE